MQRRRSAPHTLEECIAVEKAKLEAEAANLTPGPQLEKVLKKIRQLNTASHINEWLTSPGLRPPQAIRNLADGKPVPQAAHSIDCNVS